MKIVTDSTNLTVEQIEVTKAQFVGHFAIRVYFNDGSNKLVDFKPFLEKSQHPEIRKYLNEIKSKEFQIVDGNLNWNDYDLIFPVWDLYQGKI